MSICRLGSLLTQRTSRCYVMLSLFHRTIFLHAPIVPLRNYRSRACSSPSGRDNNSSWATRKNWAVRLLIIALIPLQPTTSSDTCEGEARGEGLDLSCTVLYFVRPASHPCRKTGRSTTRWYRNKVAAQGAKKRQMRGESMKGKMRLYQV